MSSSNSSSAKAFGLIVLSVVLGGGGTLLYHAMRGAGPLSDLIGSRPPGRELHTAARQPGISVDQLQQQNQEARSKLRQAIESRSEADDHAEAIEQYVREIVERSEAILAHHAALPSQRGQARRAKLVALCEGAVCLPDRLADAADAYCQQLRTEAPGTEDAAQAIAYQLMNKFLFGDRPIDKLALTQLIRYAHDYPRSELVVTLFRKAAEKQLAHRDRAGAIRVTKLGIKACVGHPNVGVLHDQLAALEGRRPGQSHPGPTRTSRWTRSDFPESADHYGSEPSRLLGMPMAIRGPTLRHGFFNLSRWRGQVVLVDFWATWCGPCRAELPTIRGLYEKYGRLGLAVVGVSLDTDRDDLASFVQSNDIGWPQVFVKPTGGSGWTNPIAQTYDVQSIPQTFLVNRRGRIVAVGLRGRQLRQAVVSELSQAR